MSSELRALWTSAGGDAPREWQVVPFESLLRDAKSIAVGVMYPGPDTPGGTPLLKVGDIKRGVVVAKPSYCISAETNEEHRRTQLLGDEFLITLVGEPGECIVVSPSMAGWNPARAIAVVRLKQPELRTYLKAVLESSAGKHLIDAVLNTTVQKTLNLKDIRRLPIPIPSSRTVAAISEMAEALSSRIALLRETNVTLEAIAQALFKSWFVDFDPVLAKQQGLAPTGMDEATAALFPDGFEDSALGLMPNGWEARSMAEVSTVGIGKTPPRKESQWFSESDRDVRWVSIRDMGAAGAFATQTSEYLTDEAIARFNIRIVPTHTALLSFKMTIGRVAITDGEMTTNEAIAHFKLNQHSPVTTEFIYLTLKQFDFLTLSSTSSIADAVNSKTVRGLPLVVPSAAVLVAFQDAIVPLFQRMKLVGKQAQTLATLRDTLLPRLISGQLRLPEAEALAELD